MSIINIVSTFNLEQKRWDYQVFLFTDYNLHVCGYFPANNKLNELKKSQNIIRNEYKQDKNT